MSQALLKAGIERDPVIEAYKRDVDRTLIRENLKPTVAERIYKHAQMQKFVENWQRAGAESRRGNLTMLSRQVDCHDRDREILTDIVARPS